MISRGNGESLREEYIREKQSKEEMHLPDTAAAAAAVQQLHKLYHSSVVH